MLIDIYLLIFIPKLKFLNKGIITSLEVIREDYQIYEEDNFNSDDSWHIMR